MRNALCIYLAKRIWFLFGKRRKKHTISVIRWVSLKRALILNLGQNHIIVIQIISYLYYLILGFGKHIFHSWVYYFFSFLFFLFLGQLVQKKSRHAMYWARVWSNMCMLFFFCMIVDDIAVWHFTRPGPWFSHASVGMILCFFCFLNKYTFCSFTLF
jgi:hypothetical protein